MNFLSDWYYTWIVDGITLGFGVEKEMGSLDESLYGSNNGKLEGLLIGSSRGYTGSKVHGSDECIKLVICVGKLLGTILVNADRITRRLDVGTELGSLDGSFYGSNDVKLEVLLYG